jgi:hypothetical protein
MELAAAEIGVGHTARGAVEHALTLKLSEQRVNVGDFDSAACSPRQK